MTFCKILVHFKSSQLPKNSFKSHNIFLTIDDMSLEFGHPCKLSCDGWCFKSKLRLHRTNAVNHLTNISLSKSKHICFNFGYLNDALEKSVKTSKKTLDMI